MAARHSGGGGRGPGDGAVGALGAMRADGRRASRRSGVGSRLWLAFILLAVSTTHAAGSALGKSEPSAGAAAPGAGVLSGPKVESRPTPAAAKSIVKRGFDGKLERLEERPEVAAVRALELTPEQRAAVDRIVADRLALVTKTTLDNYEVFLAVQGVNQAGVSGGAGGAGGLGERNERRETMARMREVTKPLNAPSLAELLGGPLTEAQRAEAARMVAEYAGALREEAAEPGASGRVGGRGGEVSAQRQEAQWTQREMARAFRLFVEERRARTDELLKAAECSGEQEEKIRAIIRQEGERAGPNATPADRGRMMQRVLAELTPEQRRKWLAAQRGG